MDINLHVLSVLALGAATLWGAIAAGIALELGPWTTGIAAAAGAGLGTALVLTVRDRIRERPPAALARTAARRRGLMYRAWAGYGVPGLGLLAPLVASAPLGAAIGILLGAPVGRLALWALLGIVLWSAGLTSMATLGVRLFWP